MFQKKQPTKKFAFSLGPKKQADARALDSQAQSSAISNDLESKRESDQAVTNPINKKPKITLDDEDDLLQSAGIPVDNGLKLFCPA